jgi:glycerol kinase
MSDEAVLAIDQGTTNSKAVLVGAYGQVVAAGSAPVGVSSPQPGWVEQDAGRIWSSVRDAVAACRANAPDVRVTAVALSTQRESVVGWDARTGEPVGPVLGWQDRRTAGWCAAQVGEDARRTVHERTGLRVDPMFSAPKMRWLLDQHPGREVRLGTVDAWLIRQLTGGRAYRTEAGNASRTLLYDITALDWSAPLLDIFGIPAAALPEPRASDAGFGAVTGVPGIPDGTPIAAVLADSHAALYGHGCTTPGTAKATYGTGSSVMAPVGPADVTGESAVPVTLAWVVGGVPTYAREGNILSSGATLAWAAELLTGGDVAALIELAESVPGSGGVTLVPAFAGLGAPYWDRDVHALISGLGEGAGRAHIARAAVDSIGHQIADIVDVITARTPLRLFRADGGATASALVVQTQADLLGRDVQVGDVAEVSALGAARLAWSALGREVDWPAAGAVYHPGIDPDERRRRRGHWAGEVARTRVRPEEIR